MTDLSHLDPEAQAALNWPLEERLEFTRKDSWIGYSRANKALGLMEDLLAHPRTLRMPNLLIVGDSGNGKSSIVSKFQERHPIHIQENGDPIAPVVSVEMPSEPSESRFWSELLISMFVAHSAKATIAEKESQARTMLVYSRTRMLIIDEIHNLLFGHARAQRQFMAALKSISNKLKIPMVCVGTREAIRAMHTDPQMVSRFEPFGLPKWKLDIEFLRLLASLERQIPLPLPSELASNVIAPKLLSLSGGTIGRLVKILKAAAILAIREKQERIDLEIIGSLGPMDMEQFALKENIL